MHVAAVLMEILRASGVRHLFGNPGTTELTFLDALPDSGLEYVVALRRRQPSPLPTATPRRRGAWAW